MTRRITTHSACAITVYDHGKTATVTTPYQIRRPCDSNYDYDYCMTLKPIAATTLYRTTNQAGQSHVPKTNSTMCVALHTDSVGGLSRTRTAQPRPLLLLHHHYYQYYYNRERLRVDAYNDEY